MSERLAAPDINLFPPLETRHVRELPAGMLLARIHAQAGPHPYRWNEFRQWGPTTSRFDHQAPPAHQDAGRAVMYATPNLPGTDNRLRTLRTCVAECFRERGNIELSRDDHYLVLFRLARPLRLLNVADSDWVALAGGNAAISSGPRAVCRDWARAIWERYTGPDRLDGLIYTCSNIPSDRSVALWEPALTAVPPKPALHLPLTSADLRADLETIAIQLHLGVIP